MATVIIDKIEDTDTLEFFGQIITAHRLRELIQGELDSDPPTGTDGSGDTSRLDKIERNIEALWSQLSSDCRFTHERIDYVWDSISEIRRTVQDLNADLRSRRIDELGGNR